MLLALKESETSKPASHPQLLSLPWCLHVSSFGLINSLMNSHVRIVEILAWWAQDSTSYCSRKQEVEASISLKAWAWHWAQYQFDCILFVKQSQSLPRLKEGKLTPSCSGRKGWAQEEGRSWWWPSWWPATTICPGSFYCQYLELYLAWSRHSMTICLINNEQMNEWQDWTSEQAGEMHSAWHLVNGGDKTISLLL